MKHGMEIITMYHVQPIPITIPLNTKATKRRSYSNLKQKEHLPY